MAGTKGRSGKNPNSLANLKDINENVSPEAKVEAGKKGGVASGEARRRKKEMKDIIRYMFELGVKNGKTADDFKSLEDTKGKNLTVGEALVLAQLKKALNGDTRAMEFLRDTAGMKPVTEQKITAEIGSEGKLNDILKALNESNDEDK
jgi:hypothetical protein